ncbi:MAG TPA: hypothetical protein VNO55_27435, partial [Polyangia bacterium]|nr:hypothetical protein [Polyangia bacterium]
MQSRSFSGAPALTGIVLATVFALVGCGSSGASPSDLPAEQPNRQLEGGTGEKDKDAGTVDAPPVEAGPFEVTVDNAPPDTARDGGADFVPEAGADQWVLPADAPGMRCNGYQELCDRRFDQVVFPAAHNAMSNADDGWVFPDQTHSIARQLEDGIRAMLIDTYSYLGSSYLCHTSCLLGNKKLAD